MGGYRVAKTHEMPDLAGFFPQISPALSRHFLQNEPLIPGSVVSHDRMHTWDFVQISDLIHMGSHTLMGLHTHIGLPAYAPSSVSLSRVCVRALSAFLSLSLLPSPLSISLALCLSRSPLLLPFISISCPPPTPSLLTLSPVCAPSARATR